MTKAELQEQLDRLEQETSSLRAGGTVISDCTLNGSAGKLCSSSEDLALAIQISAKALGGAPLIHIGVKDQVATNLASRRKT